MAIFSFVEHHHAASINLAPESGRDTVLAEFVTRYLGECSRVRGMPGRKQVHRCLQPLAAGLHGKLHTFEQLALSDVHRFGLLPAGRGDRQRTSGRCGWLRRCSTGRDDARVLGAAADTAYADR